ncbi:MAG TPA: DmsE family decaheme c-type cytochrome [Candidatus Polarisedimenticolia bacterium]|jgi:DmsE family decaheme c-type cytochrome|nr:DmsE family decaheme c-type cytochrome [Candidatus Polarisedimenticolia bacterium]
MPFRGFARIVVPAFIVGLTCWDSLQPARGQEQQPTQEQEPAKPPEPPSTAPPPGHSEFVGKETCATCHEDMATGLKRNPHGKTGVANWDGAVGCETCHGPGAAHAAEGDKTKIRNPRLLRPVEVNAICLSCHERQDRSNWLGSAHEGRGLSCLTCHKIHHTGTPPPHLFTKGDEFATCTSCHLRRNASLARSSHMPMRERQMTCSSCHNVHGGPGPSLLKQYSINENCYACHAEKRTPFLWEHPPVKESCANCHDPHGSLHPRLLVAKLPRLCQQCHDETRHPTQPYSDASTAPEFFPNARMFDRGCMNCHSQIHGSNHPSGVRFNR